MKPKRIPWPRRKKTLVWSLTAALLVVVLMAGHFSASPRAKPFGRRSPTPAPGPPRW